MDEEDQTPKVAVIRRDETKIFLEAFTKPVNQLSLDDKQCENRRIQSSEQNSSRVLWCDDKSDRGQEQDRGFNDMLHFPASGPSHRE